MVTPQQNHEQDCKAENRIIGVGLHGMGDKDYPLSVELFKQLSGQPMFIKQCSRMWKTETQAKVNASYATMPDVKVPRMLCTESFCWTHAQRELNPIQTGLTIGLLKNILRLMRSERRAQKGNSHAITGAKRHPLLFLKTDQGVFAWLIVRASFKPLYLYGWRSRISSTTLTTSEPVTVTLMFHDDLTSGFKKPKLQRALALPCCSTTCTTIVHCGVFLCCVTGEPLDEFSSCFCF